MFGITKYMNSNVRMYDTVMIIAVVLFVACIHTTQAKSFTLNIDVLDHKRYYTDISQSTPSNTTVTIPSCQWPRTPVLNMDENYTCVRLLNLSGGHEFKWRVHCILFPILFFIMALAYLHNIFRLFDIYMIDKVKPNPFSTPKPPHRDIKFYIFAGSFIGCILMGISNIDGWGLLGYLDRTTYLALYAPAYGVIGTFSVILTSVYLLEELVVSINQPYSIVSLIFMTLCILYGSVGYVIYGWILAGKMSKDPNTNFGRVGNILQYVSLSLSMLVLLFCIVPVLKSFHNRIATADAKNKLFFKRKSRRAQSWAIRQFMACAFLLCYMVTNDYANPNGDVVLGTLEMLSWSRIIELILLVNTHDLVKYGHDGYAEYFPFQLFFEIFVKLFGYNDPIFEENRKLISTKSKTSSNGSSVCLKTMDEPKGPKNSFHTTDTDTGDDEVTVVYADNNTDAEHDVEKGPKIRKHSERTVHSGSKSPRPAKRTS